MAETAVPELPPCDHKPAKYEGPSKAEVLAMRNEYLSPALFKYYRDPVMLVEGNMQYLFDENGRRYLDCFAGIVTVSVGHCHPYVTEAAVKQMHLLQHSTTIYLHPNIAEFGKMLASKLPEPLKVCYFVNSGSEANELAMLMARLYTGNNELIALRNAYHGGSSGTMGLTAHSTWKFNTVQGLGVHHAVNPDRYRGPFGYDDPNAAEKYAWDVKNLIEHATPGRVAGFIAESIQGVGGTTVYPDGYLEKVYKIVREKGGVCIADEVQTGFGRMGDHYWGFETQNVVPDIVTMAKGIGNGAALAAVVTTPEIAKVLAQKIHFNTFGGNPISTAIGKAVLETIDRENIQQNALVMGKRFMEGLTALQAKYPELIGDVRGRGLMLGVEFVKSKQSKEPHGAAAADVLEWTKDMGLLIGKGGLYGNVLRIKPPMCINAADVDFALKVLELAVAKAASKSY